MMNVLFEMKVTVDNEAIYEKEVSITDGDKEIIEAATLAAIEECKTKCIAEIKQAFEAL